MIDNEDLITLWNDGRVKFFIKKIEDDFYSGPCLTVVFGYENDNFKGWDFFSFFGNTYKELLNDIRIVDKNLNGKIHIYDMDADTDSYIDIEVEGGKARVNGRLGATFSDNSLKFEFSADQTLVTSLLKAISIKKS